MWFFGVGFGMCRLLLCGWLGLLVVVCLFVGF